MFDKEPQLHSTITQEFNHASLDIGKLAIGDIIKLNLSEGHDLEDELSLTLQLERAAAQDTSSAFRIVDSVVPERVIAKNERLRLKNPDFKEELLVVQGGITYRPGASSPVTLFHANHIEQDRHLMTGIDMPGNELGQSMTYMPFVRDIIESR